MMINYLNKLLTGRLRLRESRICIFGIIWLSGDYPASSKTLSSFYKIIFISNSIRDQNQNLFHIWSYMLIMQLYFLKNILIWRNWGLKCYFMAHFIFNKNQRKKKIVEFLNCLQTVSRITQMIYLHFMKFTSRRWYQNKISLIRLNMIAKILELKNQ